MDIKEYIFSIVMVLSAFVLTHTWITRFGPSNALIVASAMVMMGALAAMLISIDMRLKKVEEALREEESSLKFMMNAVESSLSAQLASVIKMVDDALDEFTKRIYK
jgi:hypothetical protein